MRMRAWVCLFLFGCAAEPSCSSKQSAACSTQQPCFHSGDQCESGGELCTCGGGAKLVFSCVHDCYAGGPCDTVGATCTLHPDSSQVCVCVMEDYFADWSCESPDLSMPDLSMRERAPDLRTRD